jgi:sugar lactone lactonase YvrE
MRKYAWILALMVAGLSLAASGKTPAPGYEVRRLVPGSPFHAVHGLRFDKNDTLYACSVVGQTIYKVDVKTGKVTPFIGPPDGQADDLAFAPDDGTVAWTSIEDGIFHLQTPGGPVRKLMEHQRGVNGVSFSVDGKRLFVSLVFFGDALYEVDRYGVKPPRKILENIGGLNGFELSKEGMIYGPLWFKGQLVRINPDTGEMHVVADGFGTPAAVKLDFKGSAYVADTGTREVIRVDLETGKKKVVAKFPSDLDNLAFDSKGRLYVSLSHLNAIDEVNVSTGEIREVVKPAILTSTAGLSLLSEGGHDTLYVGDVFGGVRVVNGDTGAVSDFKVNLVLPAFLPFNVTATPAHLVVVNQMPGIVNLIDRANSKVLGEWKGLQWPADALEGPDGSILVSETGTGSLLRLSGTGGSDRKAIVTGLDTPAGLAWAGPGAIFVSESHAGRVSRIDLKTGAKSTLAADLQTPEGIAVAPDGAVYVVEAAAKRVTRIDPKTGAKTTIADNLHIGLSYGPGLYRGIAVSANAIYINSDIENSIYKITPRR